MQRKNTVVFDVFAGVGPFVIPAVFLKNTIKAYANDLNPTSVEYMNESLKLNKVPSVFFLVDLVDSVFRLLLTNMQSTTWMVQSLSRQSCLLHTENTV